MQQAFNELIDSFIENNVGITDHFLDSALLANLRENLLELYYGKHLLHAGTGNQTLVAHDKLVRSDKIFWLDRQHNDIHENSFFNLMDSFVSYLNRTCYTGITGYEFHYTLYEAGSFYTKHIDQFRTNQSRQYSMIMYLNNNWQEEDGGELRIHHQENVQNISPDNGKMVFFRSSELEHEVLITHKPRLSITGWLKID